MPCIVFSINTLLTVVQLVIDWVPSLHWLDKELLSNLAQCPLALLFGKDRVGQRGGMGLIFISMSFHLQPSHESFAFGLAPLAQGKLLTTSWILFAVRPTNIKSLNAPAPRHCSLNMMLNMSTGGPNGTCMHRLHPINLF